MSGKFCHKCGAELPEKAKFCPVCGERVNINATQEDDEAATASGEQGTQEEDNSQERDGSLDAQESYDGQNEEILQYYEERSKSRKSLIVLLAVLGTLIIIVLGVLAYADYKDKRAERLAREQFVRDSIDTARKDSMMYAEQMEREREDSIKFARELPKRIKDAYIGKLDECNDNESDDLMSCAEYFLYDINRDGIPELWIKTGTCEADYNMAVYTYKDEELIDIYELSAGHAAFYRGKGYILAVYGHMGYATWNKIAYDGQKITEKTVFEENVEDDYTEPNETYIEMYRTTNKTPVINMKIMNQEN